jgi:hypothetical protein
VFKLFDEDQAGRISFQNLKRVCEMIGERLSDEEIQEMIDEVLKSQIRKVRILILLPERIIFAGGQGWRWRTRSR